MPGQIFCGTGKLNVFNTVETYLQVLEMEDKESITFRDFRTVTAILEKISSLFQLREQPGLITS